MHIISNKASSLGGNIIGRRKITLPSPETPIAGWYLEGNEGTDDSKLGTINAKALRFITNNLDRMIIDSSGKIGIGIAIPLYNFHFKDTGTLTDGPVFELGDGNHITVIPIGGNVFGNALRMGILNGSYFELWGQNRNLYIHSEQVLFLRGNSYLTLQHDSVGNVVIGKSTDDGLALVQIEEDLRVKMPSGYYSDISGDLGANDFTTKGHEDSYRNTRTVTTSDAVPDTNYTTASDYTELPTITANRVLTIPDPTTAVNSGRTLIVKNKNSAGFTWSFAGTNVKDKTDATFTTMTNDTVYTLFSNGSVWSIISIY